MKKLWMAIAVLAFLGFFNGFFNSASAQKLFFWQFLPPQKQDGKLTGDKTYFFKATVEGRTEFGLAYLFIEPDASINGLQMEGYINNKLDRVFQYTAAELQASAKHRLTLAEVKVPIFGRVAVVTTSSPDFKPQSGGKFTVYFRRVLGEVWGEFDLNVISSGGEKGGWVLQSDMKTGREQIVEIHFYQRSNQQGICRATGLTPDQRWIELASYSCN